jgi:hypothetical protein
VLREVNRLVEAGLLRERRAGNTRLVAANTTSPYYEPLVQILGRAYGPASAVLDELAGVEGVERRSGFLQEVQDRPHLTVIDSTTGTGGQ